MRSMWIAWALTLGLALTLTAGPGSFVAMTDDGAPAPGDTQDSEIATGIVDGATPLHDEEFVTLGLAVRWGYLHDPAVAGLEGRWQFNEDASGGAFHGRWHVVDGRAHGFLHGVFALPEDGHGRFRGTWNFSTGEEGGFLQGVWVRLEHGHGFFEGRWNFSDDRRGGALAGAWRALTDGGGGFRGHAIAAPTLRPVDWDGFLQTTDGIVHVVREVRWESDGHRRLGTADRVLPRDNRLTVEWLSTTTVNWDGLVFAIRVPRTEPVPHVTLHTDQASFVWEATELPGLHVRERVDDAGHAIEVRGFLLERHREGDRVRVEIGLGWGSPPDAEGPGAAMTWDGSAALTQGALHLVRVVHFEDGDAVLPREDRGVIAWESTTEGDDRDGLILVAVVPLDAVRDARFSLTVGGFHVEFGLDELLGHHVFDVDGGQLVVRATRA